MIRFQFWVDHVRIIFCQALISRDLRQQESTMAQRRHVVPWVPGWKCNHVGWGKWGISHPTVDLDHPAGQDKTRLVNSRILRDFSVYESVGDFDSSFAVCLSWHSTPWSRIPVLNMSKLAAKGFRWSLLLSIWCIEMYWLTQTAVRLPVYNVVG